MSYKKPAKSTITVLVKAIFTTYWLAYKMSWDKKQHERTPEERCL